MSKKITEPMAMDGHRPAKTNDGHRPQQTDRGHQPSKVQGGYQSPGTVKPAAPTTGSGVQPPKPSDKK